MGTTIWFKGRINGSFWKSLSIMDDRKLGRKLSTDSCLFTFVITTTDATSQKEGTKLLGIYILNSFAIAGVIETAIALSILTVILSESEHLFDSRDSIKQ